MDRRTQRVHRYLEHRGSQPSNPDLMQMLQTQAEHIYQQSTQIEALRQRVTELENAASRSFEDQVKQNLSAVFPGLAPSSDQEASK